MNDFIVSEIIVPTPPCWTMQAVDVADTLVFWLTPDVTTFARKLTLAERAAGISEPYAIVQKTPDGISRRYGAPISLNQEKL